MAITDAQKLSLYNNGLAFISEGPLGSLTENRGPRRVLDRLWDSGAVRYCLEQGLWNFATRVAKLSYDPSIETSFGYRRVFRKPNDYVRTVAVNSDEYFRSLFTAYDDKGGFLYADIDDIFFAYVSDASEYGLDYTVWTENFKRYVEAYLGIRACKQVTGAEPSDKMLRELKKLESSARSKDALNLGSKALPTGTWVRARSSNFSRENG